MYLSISPLSISTIVLLFFSLIPTASANGLTDTQIDIVKQRLQEGATHSWELGTRAQALLELSAPSFSVLTPSVPLPPPSSLNSSSNASLADVFTIARHVVAVLPSPPSNGTGQPLVVGDSSAGDPASIGTAVLLANWTGLGDEDYARAATAQVEYLFGPVVPKTIDGAISHRVSQLQLWSDSVYMVPPFLAYYGVTTSNRSMLQEAYEQIKLYRQYLSDSWANGLWHHVVLGSNGTDLGHWSTGNAWAAAGMLRVLGTLKQSSFSGEFQCQIRDLGNWVDEIHGAMYPHLQSNGLFKNYADGSFNSSRNFDDASSSALLAATVYRLALLTGNKKYVMLAERTRAALFESNYSAAASYTTTTATSSPSPSPSSSSSSASSAFSDTTHFTSDGWLVPVVDPLDIGVQGAQSPEGQAFALMLDAAWRDWLAAGSPGATSNSAPTSPTGTQGAGWGGGMPVLGSVWLVMACTFGDLII
ncbi:Six-hairpin glycosidase [Russula earlei]|uniref:Six-hairpin glycosidase n=1 Tax=Russula earlei TaxID=71964 RepID=A0ACC0U843_9AGAM|nr:Six-hairpin glycosidase [Russula earlei]